MSKIRIFKDIYNLKIFLFTIFICFVISGQIFSQQIFFNSKAELVETHDKAALFLKKPAQQIYCEEALIRIADIIDKANEENDAYLIIILHLASGERLNLFEKRRSVLEVYLKKHFNRENQKYVIAQGSRIKEKGQVDFYVAGKLIEKLSIKRNNSSICIAN